MKTWIIASTLCLAVVCAYSWREANSRIGLLTSKQADTHATCVDQTRVANSFSTEVGPELSNSVCSNLKMQDTANSKITDIPAKPTETSDWEPPETPKENGDFEFLTLPEMPQTDAIRDANQSKAIAAQPANFSHMQSTEQIRKQLTVSNPFANTNTSAETRQSMAPSRELTIRNPKYNDEDTITFSGKLDEAQLSEKTPTELSVHQFKPLPADAPAVANGYTDSNGNTEPKEAFLRPLTDTADAPLDLKPHDEHLKPLAKTQANDIEASEEEPILSVAKDAPAFESLVPENGGDGDIGDTMGYDNQTENDSWWNAAIQSPLLDKGQSQEIDVQTVVMSTLQNSQKLYAISQQPLIAETEISFARAKFDPNVFAKSLYDDRVDPVGNTLTTGGLPFLKDNIWTGTTGIKRNTVSGGQVSVQQKLGFQNSNSRFFTPQDQGTAVLSLNFEQPLARGRGAYVNRSQIVIAQTNTDIEWDDLSVAIQNELLEVVSAYWDLYTARSVYIQKRRVYETGEATLNLIKGRQQLDSQAIQLAQATAAVQSRKTELANAMRDIRLTETRLRQLMGAGLDSAQVELITSELPSEVDIPWELSQVAEIAIQNRPEIKRAVKQTRLAAVRNQVATNEILPDLSLLFGSYVAALKGDSGVLNAWQQQFSSQPGFSAGLSFDMPYRNRAARSRLRKSELEMTQAQAFVEQTTVEIASEVQQAYWRLHSANETLASAKTSQNAAAFELEQNEKRWEYFALVEGDWSEGQAQSLVLDQLLLSQQKLLVAENIVVTAEAEFKKAQVALRRDMGVLLGNPTEEDSEAISNATLQAQPVENQESKELPKRQNNDSQPLDSAPSDLPDQNLTQSNIELTPTPTQDRPQVINSNPAGVGFARPANELDSAFGGFGWGG